MSVRRAFPFAWLSSRWGILLLLALAVVGGSALPAGADSGAVVPGFDSSALSGNDDGSTSAVSLPFTVDFYGTSYSSVYVNNNGNLTFGSALGIYTPYPLDTASEPPIIAPFLS